MKQYAVFAYDGYYASGGMNDFLVSFDTIEEAEDWIKNQKIEQGESQYDYYDIEDMDSYK